MVDVDGWPPIEKRLVFDGFEASVTVVQGAADLVGDGVDFQIALPLFSSLTCCLLSSANTSASPPSVLRRRGHRPRKSPGYWSERSVLRAVIIAFMALYLQQ